MVASRRRSSLLGMLALLGGLASLLFTKVHLLSVQTVTIHSIVMPLGIAVGVGAMAVALIAFAGAAASPRTGAGLPIVAILVCAGALVLAFKPNFLSSRLAPAGNQPAPPPAGHGPAPVPAPKPAEENPAPHVKTIFDNDSPSSPAASPAPRDSAKSPTPAAAPATSHPPTPAESAAAVRTARAKLDAARANVRRSVEASDAYREAKSDADAADADLKTARQMYDIGSYKLLSADKAAIEAHKKVQNLIHDAIAKDLACQEAELELQSFAPDRPGSSNPH
ncbi:MAG TPA: hypothetical protein VGI81_27880 [Tepidisphaeraceae bacterium]|jgi:hypothetical protein